MKKGDYVVIVVLAVIIFLSFLVFLPEKGEGKSTTAVIKVDGELYKEIKLTDNYNNFIEINSKFGYNKIDILGKRVKITEADCEDKLCKNMGEIESPGQSLVCLPNRLIVYIEGDTEYNYVSY